MTNSISIEKKSLTASSPQYESEIDLFYQKLDLLSSSTNELGSFLSQYNPDYEAQKALPIAPKGALFDCSWVIGPKAYLKLIGTHLEWAYLRNFFTLVPYHLSTLTRHSQRVDLALKEVYLHPTEDIAIARLAYPVLNFNPLKRVTNSDHTNSTYYYYSRFIGVGATGSLYNDLIQSPTKPFFSWPIDLKDPEQCYFRPEFRAGFGSDFPYQLHMDTEDIGSPILKKSAAGGGSAVQTLFGILIKRNNKESVLSLAGKMPNGGSLNDWITNKMIESALHNNVASQSSTNNSSSLQIYHASNTPERLSPERKQQFNTFHQSTLQKVPLTCYLPYTLLEPTITLIAPDIALTYKVPIAVSGQETLFIKNYQNQASNTPMHVDFSGKKSGIVAGSGDTAVMINAINKMVTEIPSFPRYRGPVEKEGYYLVSKLEPAIYVGALSNGLKYSYEGTQSADSGYIAALVRDQELGGSVTQFKFKFDSVHLFRSPGEDAGVHVFNPKHDPLGLQVIKVVSDGKKLMDYKFVGIVTGWNQQTQELSVTDCTRPELANKLDNLVISRAIRKD